MPIEVAANMPQNPKTCLITLVQPGLSDAVLKVWPAEHDSEKIWLDRAPEIQRWEAIQRLMENHAERGTRVSKPVHWHSDPKQSVSPDLKPENIPVVKLDGVALKAPPPEERLQLPNQNPPNVLELNKKVDDLTNVVSALATQLSHFSTGLMRQSEPQKPEGVFKVYTCDKCSKKFTNQNILNRHVGRFHKVKEG